MAKVMLPAERMRMIVSGDGEGAGDIDQDKR